MILAVYFGAAGLAAVQLGAGIAATRKCLRGVTLPYAFVGIFSFPPECGFKFIFPDLFEKYGVFKYGRPENFWQTTPYIGTATHLQLFTLAQSFRIKSGVSR